MASDGEERTEEPTSKKLSDARKKGQIPRSKELGTTAVLIMSAVALVIFGGQLAGSLKQIMERGLTLNRDETYDPNKMGSLAMSFGEELIIPMGLIFGVILFSAFVGNSLLGGFNWSWESIKPKLDKLSPLKGLKRMFGVQALVELLKSVLKVVVVFAFSIIFLQSYFTDMLQLALKTTPTNIIESAELLAWIFLGLTFSMVLITAVDAPYQKWNHKKQLRMTKQEIKDEYKNTEGNPEIKGRIRRAQREASQRRMMQAVPDADVVVTNPTHYAVAIKYDANHGGAPMLVASGVDEMAMQIRKIAKEHGVPIIESPSLARTIFYTTEVDQEIPEKLFVAVAQVLAYVYQLKQYQKGKGQKPRALSKKLPIPPEIRH